MHYFLLGDNVFALMPWLVKPYRGRQFRREKRRANYRISRGRRVMENVFGILESRFRVLLGTMEQRLKVVRDIVLTYVVLQNMLRAHQGGADMASTPAGDYESLQNKQVVYVPDDNYRKLLKEVKHQQDLLKIISIIFVHWLVMRTESDMGATLGTEEANIYQSFSGLPNYSKNFYYLSWCCSNFQTISPQIPIHFQRVSKQFSTK